MLIKIYKFIKFKVFLIRTGEPDKIFKKMEETHK